LPGDIGTHAAVAQDEVRQDREHRFTRGALNAPDGETTQAHSHIMGVTSQPTAAVTGRFVGELKPRERMKARTNSTNVLPSLSSLK